MLKTLHIRNLAIIEELTVEFQNGLNIITGETGAGKSILVNALNYLIGERFSKDMIRTNERNGVIEGEFVNSGKTTTIRRVFNQTGASKCFIDEAPVSLDLLKEKSEILIDMHGQHDHQRLLNPANHLEVLDAYGNYQKDLQTVASLYKNINELLSKIQKFKTENKRLKEKRELNEFQLKELSLISLEFGLDDELEKEYRFLTEVTTIREKLKETHHILEDNSISSAIRSLSDISHHKEEFKELESRLDKAQIELSDISNELEHLQSSIFVDEEHFAEISEKIEHIEMLKRKYGGSLKAVLDYKTNLEEQIELSDTSTSSISKFEKELSEIQNRYYKICKTITGKRKNTSSLLEQKITKILQKMDMPNTKFKIELQRLNDSEISQTGLEKCEFFISTNIGEKLRPLVKVASGGELSRIMLAVKMELKNKDVVDTMIFDEIDSGISGSTAEKIGNIIENLGEVHQILCITHLPQIAGKGEVHFKVRKEQDNKRTRSIIQKLDKDSRINEIAFLISGVEISESSRIQAKQLLGATNG